MEPVDVLPDGETSTLSGTRASFISGRDGLAVISPLDAWAVQRALAGLDLNDRNAVELVRDWEDLGETKATLLNARNAMEAGGRLSVDDARTLQVWQMVQDEEPVKDWVVEGPSGDGPGQVSADLQDDKHF